MLRVIIEFMDKPLDNANFQKDIQLIQLFQDKEGKSIDCRNVKDVMKIIQTIENATGQYRRNVGSSPDHGQLKMLVWTVLIPSRSWS